MWRLKVGEGGDNPYIYSTNNYLGRQIWEFDPNAGTPEERAEVEEARRNFFENRYNVKPSSDLLWRFQSENGGMSAWEPAGAKLWFEWLNPVEFLEDLVIEYE
ncbi:Beta-amyrin synthase [Tripterygium wilfordii]|uniref:Beta-amyrin synthase n=1 Tax=Tripterygium wilfordii TaxID=458696 RepID=A0A7J7DF15_TRIWF|nr:Beta-amyrin synthase [Tripterygium wilfordii]